MHQVGFSVHDYKEMHGQKNINLMLNCITESRCINSVTSLKTKSGTIELKCYFSPNGDLRAYL